MIADGGNASCDLRCGDASSMTVIFSSPTSLTPAGMEYLQSALAGSNADTATSGSISAEEDDSEYSVCFDATFVWCAEKEREFAGGGPVITACSVLGAVG